jgi:uncharacterized protein YkwD
MSFRLSIPRFTAILAICVAAIALAATAFASTASASPCTKFGDAKPGTISSGKAERAIHCLVNRQRERHGLHRLSYNYKLTTAAGRHSNYMVSHHCFLHQCPGEASPETRLRLAGYLTGVLRSWSYGENIAWGEDKRYGTPHDIVQAWMHSPEHRANILNPRFKRIGVGIIWESPAGSRVPAGTYTTDFGYTG